MIQRIQTLWLALIPVFSIFLFTGSLLTLEGPGDSIIFVKPGGVEASDALNDGPAGILLLVFSGILILMAIVSLAAIMLYRNRRLQAKAAKLLIVLASLSTASLIALIIVILRGSDLALIAGPRLLIPPLMIVLAFLALRGVRKDERLVSSYERLR